MSEKKKIKQPVILAQSYTHWSIILIPMLFTFIATYYTFITPKINWFLIFGVIISWGAIYYFNFYGKKIVLTDKKIYIFSKNKKIISWSLTKDFAYINYEQTKFNKFFKCGTLIIVSEQKQMFTYFFLANVVEIYNAIIEAFENEMIKQNPNYQRQAEQSSSKIDKLDD